MIRLTTKNVNEIHDYLIETDGGEPGIRDIGTLEYLIENINRKDDAFEKAAWALLLADRHPFWDGQKRTAFQLADLILRDAGYHIHAEDDEIIQALTKIAEYECDVQKILKWVRRKARKMEGSLQLHFG